MSTTTDTTKATPPSRFSLGPVAKIWDLPVRLCHWSFALLIPALWWSAENSEWALHKRFGVTLLGLLIFRILWGFMGSKTAKFSQFVRGPGVVLSYLRGAHDHVLGHNPVGALSVLALLGVMLVQVSTGLFAGDPFDGATGPLNPLVGVATADSLTDWHEWFYWVVLGMVAIHLSAIAFYGIVKQDDLVSPMLSGTKPVDSLVEENSATPWLRFAIAASVAAGVAFWVAYGAPPFG